MIFLKITKQWQHVNHLKILSHLVEKNKFLIGGSAKIIDQTILKIKSHKIIKANDLKEILYTLRSKRSTLCVQL